MLGGSSEKVLTQFVRIELYCDIALANDRARDYCPQKVLSCRGGDVRKLFGPMLGGRNEAPHIPYREIRVVLTQVEFFSKQRTDRCGDSSLGLANGKAVGLPGFRPGWGSRNVVGVAPTCLRRMAWNISGSISMKEQPE
jgi:hypothetical protein